jgi:energy-coupling factor transporter ATP-binding protein EcfA2
MYAVEIQGDTSMLFFQNFKAKNYRVFKDFTIAKLRRVNVIGGLNGAGKSTLLEALFVLADHSSIVAPLRPLIFRGIATSAGALDSAVFSSGLTERSAMLEANTSIGRINMNFVEEIQPPPPDSANLPFEASTISTTGLTITTEIDGAKATVLHAVGRTADIQSWLEPGHQQKAIPTCIMLSRRLQDAPSEIGDRFSRALVKKQKKKLIGLLQIIAPSVTDLTLLQVGGQSSVYVSVEDENLLPLSFIGDGASTFLSAALAVLDAAGGAVFIDEIDATIHFTALRSAWSGLISLAREVNTQIFVASHSQEAIDAIASASEDAGATQDFQYLRLDRRRNGEISATSYVHAEYSDARDEGWEVR